MKQAGFPLFMAALLMGGPAPTAGAASWAGVDETVIQRFATAAGRPAWGPFLNTDQGDLLLFCFLVAGLLGGFVAGYAFRALFPPRTRQGQGKGEAPGQRRGAVPDADGRQDPGGGDRP